MNIKEAKQEIKNTVKAYLAKDEMDNYKMPSIRQRPILLMGPPGIGKTQIMEQIARECQISLVAYTITHHTRQSAVGLPFIREKEYDGKKYSVTEYTMSEIIASIYEKKKETGLQEGILFIDEINCVSETLAPTMLQFLQCKTFGNQSVPEGWIIVAAGNPPEYNKSVRDFDMVTLDRVREIGIEADYGVWKEYAREQGIAGEILSYLELRPKNFYRVEADVDGLSFVTARGWEDLSQLLQVYETMKIPVTQEIVHEFLRNEDVAEDVAAYIDLYQKYRDDYGIPDILQGRVKTEVYARLFQAAFDEKISVVNLLLDGIDQYLKKLEIQKELLEDGYAFLRRYQEVLKNDSEKTVAEKFALVWKEMEDKLTQEARAGFLPKEKMTRRKEMLRQWKSFAPKQNVEARQAFAQLKEIFDGYCDEMEIREKATAQAFECAFDFMEKAFEGGQEMVIFVTELTLNARAAVFLSEHTCERYGKYHKELLIGTRKRELLQEMEH